MKKSSSKEKRYPRYQLLVGCPNCKSKNIVKTEDAYLCRDYQQDYQIRKFAFATISFAMLRKAISPLFEALSYTTYLPFPILSDINPSGGNEVKI